MTSDQLALGFACLPANEGKVHFEIMLPGSPRIMLLCHTEIRETQRAAVTPAVRPVHTAFAEITCSNGLLVLCYGVIFPRRTAAVSLEAANFFVGMGRNRKFPPATLRSSAISVLLTGNFLQSRNKSLSAKKVDPKGAGTRIGGCLLRSSHRAQFVRGSFTSKVVPHMSSDRERRTTRLEVFFR